MNFKNCGSHGDVNRRHFLLGAASAAGFHLMHAHADAEVIAKAAVTRKTASACIFINLAGAPSHLDTFAPKDGPWNPADADLRQYPGGIVLSRKFFPRLSTITNDLCILRSVQSWEAAHERGQFYVQTSHPSNPTIAQETPHIGAVVSRELGDPAKQLPPFLAFYSSVMHGQAFDDLMATYADFYGSSKQMMYNPAITSVFRYTDDDEGRYGNTNIGRGLINARNAIRARNGAVFVNVTMDGWDTHQQMFDTTYAGNIYHLTNDLDRAVGALVEDLNASGDFSRTMIVAMGEFGRTPGPLNTRGGRDHHKFAMAALMLGGGVKGGRIIGDQALDGSVITDPGWRGNRPIFMEDITATIYSALGIDWTKSYLDTPSGRKFEFVPCGAEGAYFPIDEVFGG